MMSLNNPNIQITDGSNLRFAIVASRYNEVLVNTLVQHTTATLSEANIPKPAIERVPGAAELPYAVGTLADHTLFDAIIAIGVVIAGDTDHHLIIGNSTAWALQKISIRQKVPVINGILVVNSIDQAEARVGEPINRGKEFALAAIEMARFRKRWKTTNQ